jgi:imidazolonepropionase
LPVADLSTRHPGRTRGLLRAGVRVALATDCNPGTSFTTNMPLVVALAVTAMRMTPAEAIQSATAGGAAALRRIDVGRIAPGAFADSSCSTRPRTSTWPTGRARRWCAT